MFSKKKLLCVFVLDVSGSMEGREQQILDYCNEIIATIFDYDEKEELYLLVLEFNTNVRIVVDFVKVADFIARDGFLSLENDYDGGTFLSLALTETIRLTKDWNFTHGYNFFTKFLYQTHIVLFTDLTENEILLQDEYHPFIHLLNSAVRKKDIVFWGVEVGSNANLSVLNQTNSSNIIISNEHEIVDDFTWEIGKLLTDDISDSFSQITVIKKFKEIWSKNKPNFNMLKNYAPLKKWLQWASLWLLLPTLLFYCFGSLQNWATKQETKEYANTLNASLSSIGKEGNNFNLIVVEPPTININNNLNITTNFNTTFEIIEKDPINYADTLNSYDLGIYEIKNNIKTQEAFNAVYTALQQIDNNARIKGQINISVTGEADANRIINQKLLYKGEYDNILSKPYYLCSSPNIRYMKLQPNDVISTNERLAYLRGYSVWDLLRRHLDMFVRCPTNYKQFVKINDKTNKFGAQFRKVTIKIEITDIETKNAAMFSYIFWSAIVLFLFYFLQKFFRKVKQIKVSIPDWFDITMNT